MEAPVKDNRHTSLSINKDFSQWDDAGIAYRKYIGDCAPMGRLNYTYYFG